MSEFTTEAVSTEEFTYNGWTNRATWAMGLNLGNDEYTYRQCESAARYAAVGNEESPEDFRAELADALRKLGRDLAAAGYLPDFDVSAHESADPSDPNGPDDIDAVNWVELAESYELAEYV